MNDIQKARAIAALAWCQPETGDKVMDPILCEEFAKILLREVNEAVNAALVGATLTIGEGARNRDCSEWRGRSKMMAANADALADAARRLSDVIEPTTPIDRIHALTGAAKALAQGAAQLTQCSCAFEITSREYYDDEEADEPPRPMFVPEGVS